MNLRWVHAVLIMLSAALAVLFGVWCLAQYGRGGGAAEPGRGRRGLRRVVGLVVYDSWFLRKTRTLR